MYLDPRYESLRRAAEGPIDPRVLERAQKAAESFLTRSSIKPRPEQSSKPSRWAAEPSDIRKLWGDSIERLENHISHLKTSSTGEEQHQDRSDIGVQQSSRFGPSSKSRAQSSQHYEAYNIRACNEGHLSYLNRSIPDYDNEDFYGHNFSEEGSKESSASSSEEPELLLQDYPLQEDIDEMYNEWASSEVSVAREVPAAISTESSEDSDAMDDNFSQSTLMCEDETSVVALELSSAPDIGGEITPEVGSS
jgi:hypothetical protein